MPTPEEQKALDAYKTGGLTAFSSTLASPDTTKITADSLKQESPMDFKTAETTPPADISGLNSEVPAPLVATEQENKQSDLTKSIMDSRALLLGESAFRAEAEKTQGIDALTKIQTDLSSQLKAIQNEAKSISLQMQQDAKGKGITAGGLRPLETARLRTNAIQALGVSSLLEASRGNLATAQTLADRAVAQKFDPIKAELAANIANLETIKNDPKTSLQDKNRAQAQLDIQKKKDAETKKAEEDAKTILTTAQEAAKNGADALTLQKIQNAKTPLEAITAAGKFTGKQDTSIVEVGGKKLLVNNQTGETVKDLGASGDVTASLMEKYPDAGILPTDDIAVAQRKLKGSKIYQKDINIKGTGGSGLGGGVSGVISQGTQAIIDNPSLFDDLTPTVKGKIISELQANGYDTSNLGVKGLSDTAINTVAQTQKALDDLDNLKSIIEGNEDKLGPITGFARLNPWSESRKIQADVDRVRQTVGKALEGGVLRKEDEEKYKKILATLNDTPSTATYKIDALISSIQRDMETYKSLQQTSGRSADVGKSLEKKGAVTTSPEDLRNKYKY